MLKLTDDEFRSLLAKKHPLIQRELSSGYGLNRPTELVHHILVLIESCLSIIALLGAAFALSVSCYLGPSSYLLFCATIIMLLALFLLLRSSVRDQSISWSHIHSITCVYVAWLAVSVYFSTLPGNSILFFWLLASFPIVLLLSSGFSSAEWQKVFALFLIAGVISAVWGIAEFWVSGKRANGPLIDPNSWCAFNNLFFFGVFANYLKGPDTG